MKSALAALVLLLSLAACGGDGEASSAEPSETESVAPATLKETCPQVEAAIGKDWDVARDEVQALSDAGDLETQQAVERVIAALTTLAERKNLTGMALLDARAAIRDSLSGLADRCNAVGSSSLQ